jgi:hypothetical protein
MSISGVVPEETILKIEKTLSNIQDGFSEVQLLT